VLRASHTHTRPLRVGSRRLRHISCLAPTVAMQSEPPASAARHAGCIKGAHASQLLGCTSAGPGEQGTFFSAHIILGIDAGVAATSISGPQAGLTGAFHCSDACLGCRNSCRGVPPRSPELLVSVAFAMRSRSGGASCASCSARSCPPPWMLSGPLLGMEGMAMSLTRRI